MNKSALPNCGNRKQARRARLKKNLFDDLLALDIVPEVEILLGHQAVENLDFEALEIAVRQQVLRLAGQAVAQRLNADLSDEVGSRIRVVVDSQLASPGGGPSKCRVFSVPYHLNAPTITALAAARASALGISI